jgi:hypothetical protein
MQTLRVDGRCFLSYLQDVLVWKGVGWLMPSVCGFSQIRESLTIFKSGEICRTLGVAEGCSSLLRFAGLWYLVELYYIRC